MSSTAITRVAKIKTTRDLFAVYGHHFRTEPFQENEFLMDQLYKSGKSEAQLQMTPFEKSRKSYDPDLEHLNSYEGGYAQHKAKLDEINDERVEMGRSKLRDDKIGRSPNKGLDFLISLGEDAQDDMTKDELNAYFDDSVEFLKEKYPDMEIMGIAKHFDEPHALPHMHVVCLPVKTRTKKNVPSLSVDKLQLNPKAVGMQWKQFALFHQEKGRDVDAAGSGNHPKRKYLPLKEFKAATEVAWNKFNKQLAKMKTKLDEGVEMHKGLVKDNKDLVEKNKNLTTRVEILAELDNIHTSKGFKEFKDVFDRLEKLPELTNSQAKELIAAAKPIIELHHKLDRRDEEASPPADQDRRNNK